MKISVFIPSYNQKEFLVDAIESVLNQTLQPCQIIIADDCSQDGSHEIINGYASRYKNLVTPIFHENNTGISQVRVDALHAVTGDYVTYVDGDDKFLPAKLEKEARALKNNPKAKIAFSNYYFISKGGRRSTLWADNTVPPEGDVFPYVFAREFPGKTLFRNELVRYNEWKRIGFHDPNLPTYEDFEMRIRLTKTLKTTYINEPLSEYRVHDQGLSSVKRDQQFKSIAYIFTKNKHLLSDIDEPIREYIRTRLSDWVIDLFCSSIQVDSRSESYHNETRSCADLLHTIGACPWNTSSEELPETIMEEYLIALVKSKNMENHLNDIRNSFSWKITRPLRKLAGLFTNYE